MTDPVILDTPEVAHPDCGCEVCTCGAGDFTLESLIGDSHFSTIDDYLVSDDEIGIDVLEYDDSDLEEFEFDLYDDEESL